MDQSKKELKKKVARTTSIHSSFSPEQFYVLLRVLSLGRQVYEYMGEEVDENFKKFTRKVDVIMPEMLSNADSLGTKYEENIKQEKERALFDLSIYDRFMMLDYLSVCLAERDLMFSYTCADLEAMPEKEFVQLVTKAQIPWRSELRKHGISRIGILEEKVTDG